MLTLRNETLKLRNYAKRNNISEKRSAPEFYFIGKDV